MNYYSIDSRNSKEVVELFTSVFTSSEGEEEGKLLGQLVSGLASNIDNEEVFCFGAATQELLVGSIFFTRLRFEELHSVYMLAPVAVDTKYQGKGVGQSLIRHGLKIPYVLSVSMKDVGI